MGGTNSCIAIFLPEPYQKRFSLASCRSFRAELPHRSGGLFTLMITLIFPHRVIPVGRGLAPAAIGGGGNLSPIRHARQFVSGIHPLLSVIPAGSRRGSICSFSAPSLRPEAGISPKCHPEPMVKDLCQVKHPEMNTILLPALPPISPTVCIGHPSVLGIPPTRTRREK